jgi:hypothetical protein
MINSLSPIAINQIRHTPLFRGNGHEVGSADNGTYYWKKYGTEVMHYTNDFSELLYRVGEKNEN